MTRAKSTNVIVMTFETARSDQESDARAVDGEDNLAAPSGPRRTPRRAHMIGIFIVVVAAVAAFSWVTRSSDTTTVAVEDPISRVELTVASGDVNAEPGASVRFESRADHGWIRSARITHGVDGETLRIEGGCRGNSLIPGFGCRTDVTLTVPDGVDVVARVSSGDITTSGLTGTTTLESTSGRIDVADQAGTLRAQSTAGDVTVTDLYADEAHVSSRAGSVRVDASTPPRSLDAESSAGDVSVGLPAGQQYAIEAKSRAGGVTIDAEANYSSVYGARAFSNAGDVTVAAR